MLLKTGQIKTSIKKFVLFPLAVLVSVIYPICLFLVIVVLFIPCLLYKILIILLAKFAIPTSKVMGPFDSLMARDNFHKTTDMYDHTQWNFKGKINFSEFLEVWEERVMKKKFANGKLKFPELKCYIKTWMGFFFHTPEKTFDLKNHVKLYENSDNRNSIIDTKTLDKIRKEFVCTLFPVKKSPWEVLIVSNCRLDDNSAETEHSVVILKIHHCLADAYCLLILLWESLLLQDLQSFTKPKFANKEENVLLRFFATVSAVTLTFKILGELAFYFVYDSRKVYDENSWHSPKKTSDHVHCILKPIETSVIKQISQGFNVSITTVLHAVTTGGIRRLMEAKGFTSPKTIRTTYSLPLPNHPDRLTNNSGVTFFSSNLINSADEKARLQSIEKEAKTAIGASLNFAMPFGRLALKAFPMAIIRYLPQEQYPFSLSALLATVPIPSPPSEVGLLGCQLIGMDLSIEVSGNTNIPATICVFKYQQHFFINFGIQTHLLTSEDDVYDIEKYVLEELGHLKQSI